MPPTTPSRFIDYSPHSLDTASALSPDCRMERLVWICLAGAAGTGARYLIALWAAQRFGSAFPYGTLVVNLIGCFVIAALMHAALTLGWSPTLRAALTI